MGFPMTSGTLTADQLIADATCPQPATMMAWYLFGACPTPAKEFESSIEKVVLMASGTMLSKKLLPVMTVAAEASEASSAGAALIASFVDRLWEKSEFFTVAE